MAKSKTTNQGNKHPMPSSRKSTRSPGGGEAARRKVTSAYLKSPAANTPKQRAKRKRNEMIAGIALSAVPVAGAAGKAIKVVNNVRYARQIPKAIKKLNKATYKAEKYLTKGDAKKGLGKTNQASKFYKKSVKQGNRYYDTKDNLARIRRMSDVQDKMKRGIDKMTTSEKNLELRGISKDLKNIRKNSAARIQRDKQSIKIEEKLYGRMSRSEKNAKRAIQKGERMLDRSIDKFEKTAGMKFNKNMLKDKPYTAAKAYTRERATSDKLLRRGHDLIDANRGKVSRMGPLTRKPLPSTTKQSPMVPIVGAGAAAAKAKGLRDTKRRPSNTGNMRGRARPAPRKPNQTPLRNRAKPLPRKPY